MNEEIEQVVQEQIDTVRGAGRELQRVLLETALMEEYRKATAPLDEEAGNLAEEIQTLVNARDELTPRLEARRRLLATEIDQCIAAGNDEEAATKRRQQEQEETRLRAMGEKITQYGDRCAAISKEKQDLGKQIFESAYPDFPKATFAILEATIDLLDGLRQGMLDYAETTGISGTFPYMLPKQYHLDNLLPNPLPGSNRQLFYRVDACFGRRR
jgi:DNA-binding FrmR family transcriptional regulator